MNTPSQCIKIDNSAAQCIKIMNGRSQNDVLRLRIAAPRHHVLRL